MSLKTYVLIICMCVSRFVIAFIIIIVIAYLYIDMLIVK